MAQRSNGVITLLCLDTVSDVCLKLGCFQSTSTYTALEVSHFMRYIKSRLTYRGTYLLTNAIIMVHHIQYKPWRNHRRLPMRPLTGSSSAESLLSQSIHALSFSTRRSRKVVKFCSSWTIMKHRSRSKPVKPHVPTVCYTHASTKATTTLIHMSWSFVSQARQKI